MDEGTPLVSVIIPFRGRFALVAEALRSLRIDDHPDMEVVLVDDASEPPATLDRFGVVPNERVRLIRTEKNLGGGGARNLGIDASRGRWIAFLDSDDVWIPEEISTRLRLCVEDRHSVVYGRVRAVGLGKERLLPDRAPRSGETLQDYLFLHHGLIQTSTIMLRAEVAKQVRFDDFLRKHQDLDFCLRLESRGHEFHYCDRVLAEWRIDPREDRTTLGVNPEASLSWVRSRKQELTLRCRLAFLVHQVVPQWLRSGRLLVPLATLLAAMACFSVTPPVAARVLKWGVASRCRP